MPAYIASEDVVLLGDLGRWTLEREIRNRNAITDNERECEKQNSHTNAHRYSQNEDMQPQFSRDSESERRMFPRGQNPFNDNFC